jgi:peptide/nickel transport system ATP-binding protein
VNSLPTRSRVSSEPLLEIRDVSVEYGTGEDAVRAVDSVNLVIHRGEAVGLAGESGSGKSTLALAVTRLLRYPGRISAGQVLLHPPVGDGPAATAVDLVQLGRDELRPRRWEEVAVVLQSAMNALNPVLNLRTQLTDVLAIHRPQMSKAERSERAGELLDIVGVSRDRLSAFPHELSGGMRQRAIIGMALALQPSLIVMDEPTTALDVVTQRQILEEIAELRDRFGFAMLLITHDLSLLLEVSDTIAVMYGGQLVEVAAARQLHADPAHPYTAGLLGCFPPLRGERRTLVGIPGSPPDLHDLPPGCAFAPRCSHVTPECSKARPPLIPVGRRQDSGGRVAACIHDLVAENNHELTPQV